MEDKREVLLKVQESLGGIIYQLTWGGYLFGSLSVIPISRMRCRLLELLGRKTDGWSALASIYYTAYGNAFAKAELVGLAMKPVWRIRGIWYLWLALRISDRLERDVGIKKMSPGQLDVRANILAAAFWRPGRYKKALACIEEALSREDLSNGDLALLARKEGEIHDSLGEIVIANYAFKRALSFSDVEPTTRVRVLKSFAGHELNYGRAENAKFLIKEAIALAEKNNLGDQVIKIKALMK
jgi:tetratricopeptide (TPR) repeat protein